MAMPREPEPKRTFRERLGALKNLPPFMRLVWETSRPLTIAQGSLRLFRALLPVAVLFVGKLIIDEVVELSKVRGEGDYARITALIAIEFGLAVFSDVLSRLVGLVDTLLAERVGT